MILDTIEIEGVPGLDGSYAVDVLAMLVVGSPDCLTNREVHLVKVRTSLRLPELWDALEAGDNDIYVTLAEVALQRLGKRFNPDVLWDAPVGSVTITLGARDEEASEDPQTEAPTPSGAPSTSGGPSSEPTSVSPATLPPPTGHPDSARLRESVPATSAI